MDKKLTLIFFCAIGAATVFHYCAPERPRKLIYDTEVTAKTVAVAEKKAVKKNAAIDNFLSKLDKEACQKYIARFEKVAQQEQSKYGIPACVILAQGILETNAGASSLAQKNNNHFGIKCFSKKCKKGHCSNFTDDSHKDFFRKYKSAWESYRAHSQLLLKPHYAHLQRYSDYKTWAKGLKDAGYATDRLYDEKLITIIEHFELDKI